MTSRRILKVAEAVREVVSMAILTELRDPRVRDVTVTYVEVAPDLRQAKIHVSVMGDPTRQQLSLRGLQHAAGFLQQKVAQRIDTRYTPKLKFILDQGVKHSIEVSQLLNQLLPHDDSLPHDDPPSDDDPPSHEESNEPTEDGSEPAAPDPKDDLD